MATNDSQGEDAKAFDKLRDLIKYLEEHRGGRLLRTEATLVGERSVPLFVLPNGTPISIKKLIDEWRLRPERRTGTALLHDLDSLIDHVERHKDDNSVLFADLLAEPPSLTAILDYNDAGPANELARWGTHRAHYAFPLSEEWRAWNGQNREAMTQGDFAAFLEDRLADVVAPPTWLLGSERPIGEAQMGGDFGERTPQEELAHLAGLFGQTFAGPAKLVELSRGIRVHEEQVVQQAQVLQTGEAQITFRAEHKDESGAPLKVPGLFLIAIPIFHLGARYQIAVRLRYRLSQGKLFWFFELYRHQLALDHALREACRKAQRATNLPLFYGQPEAAAPRG